MTVAAASPPSQARVDPDEREQDDDADDGADDASEIQDVAVADAEPYGEDEKAEQCAGKADDNENSHDDGP